MVENVETLRVALAALAECQSNDFFIGVMQGSELRQMASQLREALPSSQESDGLSPSEFARKLDSCAFGETAAELHLRFGKAQETFQNAAQEEPLRGLPEVAALLEYLEVVASFVNDEALRNGSDVIED